MPNPGALVKASRQLKQTLRDTFEASRFSELASILSDAADAGFTRPVHHATIDIHDAKPSENPDSMGTHVDLVGGRQALDRLDVLNTRLYAKHPGVMTLLARASNPWLLTDREVNMLHRGFREREGVDSYIYPNEVEGLEHVGDHQFDTPGNELLTPYQARLFINQYDLDDPARGEFARELLKDLQKYDSVNPSMVIPSRKGLLNPFGERARRRAYNVEGFAQGGAVYDPARIQSLAAELLGAQNFAKGGPVRKTRQWLKGVVEGALGRLKGSDPIFGFTSEDEARGVLQRAGESEEIIAEILEGLKPQIRLNDWIDSTLTKYVKRDYGAEWDPIAALAPEEGWEQEMAREPSITSHPASYYLNSPKGVLDWVDSALERNPWIKTLDPEERIHSEINPNVFSHLIDELRNATRPDTDLPIELRLRPESLSRVSVPDASRLVGRINAWRAAQKAEANAALANNAATQLVKEYPEGYRWVELRKPEEIDYPFLEKYKTENAPPPEAWHPKEEPDDEQIWDDLSFEQLRQALKYEGDTMGHCVGGYCDDVASGNTRIFSLRDAMGEPHVTIEAQSPKFQGNIDEIRWAKDMDEEEIHDIADTLGTLTGNRPPIQSKNWGFHPSEGFWLYQESAVPSIHQVKGKANKKPNDKYLPMVQDFLLERGWPIKGDFGNTGLTREIDLLHYKFGSPLHQLIRGTQDTEALFKALGRDYGREDELLNKARELWPDRFPPENFAEGGAVNKIKKSLMNLLTEYDELRHSAQAGFNAQWKDDEHGRKGITLSVEALPSLAELFGEGVAPEFAMEASDQYDAHLNNMLATYGLPPTADLDAFDRFAVAFGEMAGQLPVPGGFLNKLKQVPKLNKLHWLTEYFGPIVDPLDPKNYMLGTGVGGAMRQLETPNEYQFEPTDPDEAFNNYAKGGPVRKTRQWLKGVVEDALGRFHERISGRDPSDVLGDVGRGIKLLPETEARARSAQHLNNWIDSTLTKYVKRDYGAEWDPIAALAPEERHIEEWSNGVISLPFSTYRNSADNQMITPYIEKTLRSNPWLHGLPDGERIYQWFNDEPFSHLIDELRNATNPHSDLPPELRLRPESLSRVSVPDASRLVGRINAWRQAQMAEANQALANNAATQVLKEYPDGYRWVELKKPEDTGRLIRSKLADSQINDLDIPEVEALNNQIWEELELEGAELGLEGDELNDWILDNHIERLIEHQEKTPIQFNEDEALNQLRQALKYEGDAMGHCVGGYCRDVAEGDTHIFSLRDAKGEPHVTIEATKSPGFYSNLVDLVGVDKANAMIDSGMHLSEALSEAGWKPGANIRQVKGKGNAKPNDKYLPMVQDFLLERGWPIRGDIENTGLIQWSGGITNLPGYRNLKMLEGLGTPRMASEFLQQQGVPKDIADRHVGNFEDLLGDEPGFAQGGRVTRQYNPARISQLATQLIGG